VLELAPVRLRRVAAAALIACALLSPWWPQSNGTGRTRRGMTDVEAFRTMVAKTAAGDWFYHAEGETLHRNGYPTASVLNWRLPALYVGLASLGAAFARIWLGVTIVVLLIRTGRQLSLMAALAVGNACLFILADAPLYFTETWAGVCLGLSLMASLRSDTVISMGWAVAALSIRELAAPYCVAMTLFAAWQRRWRDVGVWMIGGLFYAALYAVHIWSWRRAVPIDARTHIQSWIAFGGAPFLLENLRVQGLFVVMPRWLMGVVLAAVAIAPWAKSMPQAVRVAGLTYIVFLFVAGQPFNMYWGAIAAPLLATWLAFVGDGARTLLTRSSPGPQPAPTR
jgi:hypothetical protein